MTFNLALAKEIYGVPWSVDVISFVQLSSILKNLQNNVPLEVPENKYNAISVLQVKGETRLISREWQLNSSDSFEGIGIINMNGVITRNGGESTYGTKQLSSRMLQMSRDSRIKGFIVLTDSGGGATGAVKLMQNAITEVRKSKPVYGLVENGGLAGSAAYAILTACTQIFAESEMSVVGSSGTMIQFSGKPNGTVDANGEKHITLYASKSTMKNKGFVEAIENDNYEVLVNDMLNPVNEVFLSDQLDLRPALKGSNYDNGHTKFAHEAVGTLIDGIKSQDEVISLILSENPSNVDSNKNSNNNPNSNKMNKAEIKSAHPEAYAEILAEGASQEKERVASWMAYNEADPKAVAAGIASGNQISQAQSHQFLVAMATKGKVAALKSDNAPDVNTPETETEEVEKTEAEKSEEELKSAFDFKV